VHVIPHSLIPDVTDVDELKTGTRQEGVYYGFLVFMQKLASAFGLFLVGQFLGWAGYAPNVPQTERALWAIRLLVGPIPAVIVVGAIAFAAFYPLTRDQHRKIIEALEARRRGAVPATGQAVTE
jgi:GPH family glycoside/pentoside/hexuronide:cation symporter